MATYRIVRFYQNAGVRRRIIERGLTREEAERHCRNPETSSKTAVGPAARRRTKKHGVWFDGLEEEK